MPSDDATTSIAASVAGGVPEGADHLVIVDREEAIRRALAEARDGDVVLVLGRGHEPFQQRSGHKVEFDDRVVARRLLEERRAESG